jgi:hypothetical protein
MSVNDAYRDYVRQQAESQFTIPERRIFLDAKGNELSGDQGYMWQEAVPPGGEGDPGRAAGLYIGTPHWEGGYENLRLVQPTDYTVASRKYKPGETDRRLQSYGDSDQWQTYTPYDDTTAFHSKDVSWFDPNKSKGATMDSELAKYAAGDRTLDPQFARLFTQMDTYHEGRFGADPRADLARSTLAQWQKDNEPGLGDKLFDMAPALALAFMAPQVIGALGGAGGAAAGAGMSEAAIMDAAMGAGGFNTAAAGGVFNPLVAGGALADATGMDLMLGVEGGSYIPGLEGAGAIADAAAAGGTSGVPFMSEKALADIAAYEAGTYGTGGLASGATDLAGYSVAAGADPFATTALTNTGWYGGALGYLPSQLKAAIEGKASWDTVGLGSGITGGKSIKDLLTGKGGAAKDGGSGSAGSGGGSVTNVVNAGKGGSDTLAALMAMHGKSGMNLGGGADGAIAAAREAAMLTRQA